MQGNTDSLGFTFSLNNLKGHIAGIINKILSLNFKSELLYDIVKFADCVPS